MNKKLLLILLVILTFSHAYAQQPASDYPKIRFGIFFDPLVSWAITDFSQIEGDGARIGMNAGLMMDKFFAPHYAFTTGISIHAIGGSLNYKQGKNPFQASDGPSSLPNNTSVTYKLQYLHIPLGLKMRTSEIGYFTYFAEVGLDPMFNIKANANVPSANLSNVGVSEEINTFYAGYHASLGLEYKILGSTSAFTGLTYMNGFTDVTSDSGNATEKTVLHNIEIRLGIIF
jgi:hypothetical protein